MPLECRNQRLSLHGVTCCRALASSGPSKAPHLVDWDPIPHVPAKCPHEEVTGIEIVFSSYLLPLQAPSDFHSRDQLLIIN